jgi:voltage-gated potassium channel Kch
MKLPKLFWNYTHGHWFYLFHALLVLLIIYPYSQLTDSNLGYWILYTLNALVIIAIIYVASRTRFQLTLALILGLAALIIYWLPRTPLIEVAQYTLHSALYLYAIILLLSSLLKILKADADTIFGTISLYILLGLFWANIYQVIAISIPDAFAFRDLSANKELIWSDYLYYSFITLTTVGYGDIIPVAPQARSIAILESISGVLFIAVMVSKTIGLYVVEVGNRLNTDEKEKFKEIT